jgi:aminoglycoside phosphotransferase (APT) family kinase protein
VVFLSCGFPIRQSLPAFLQRRDGRRTLQDGATMTLLPARPLAAGRTAEVYPWGEGLILKLFHPDRSEAEARTELEKSRAVQLTGLPVPVSQGVASVAGRHGILMERINGIPLTQSLRRRPWTLPGAARELALLQFRIHSQQAAGLPSLHERLQQRIERSDALPAELRVTMLERLDALPRGTALCHGDFHPDNVLVTADGPVIIDWMDATSGHPLADAARTSLLLRLGALPEGTAGRLLITAARPLLHLVWLKHYLRQSGATRAGIAAWLAVIAAARLAEAIPGERAALLSIIRRTVQ